MVTQEIEPLTMTLEEAAQCYGISRSLAYDLARAGKFPGCFRLGKRWIVSKRATQKLLEGEAQRMVNQQTLGWVIVPDDKPPRLNNTLNYVKVDCRLRHILPELTPTDRSVLFSYGLRVNKESVSFVSVETLLKEAKRTPNMCRISRKKLVEMGLLRLVEQGGGAGKVSKYQVKYFTRGKNTPRLIML